MSATTRGAPLSALCPPADLAEVYVLASAVHHTFANLTPSDWQRARHRSDAAYMAAMLPLLRADDAPATTSLRALDGFLRAVRDWSAPELHTDVLAALRDRVRALAEAATAT